MKRKITGVVCESQFMYSAKSAVLMIVSSVRNHLRLNKSRLCCSRFYYSNAQYYNVFVQATYVCNVITILQSTDKILYFISRLLHMKHHFCLQLRGQCTMCYITLNVLLCRVQKLYSSRLKEIKQKRILAKLKKLNEKRRKYHSVSTEGKVSLSSSDNTIVSSETTTASLTNSKSAQNYKEIDLPDSLERTIDVSDNVLVKDETEATLTQSSKPTAGTVNSPMGERSEGTTSENKVTSSVMKLCGSPVRMSDTVKEEIHKLLQEEQSRSIKVDNTEQSGKLLRVQSNFKAGLLHLQNPDSQQSYRGRNSSVSPPVSGVTLSTSSTSMALTSPPASKTVSNNSGVFEESDDDNNDDDDDNVSKELKMLHAIVASKHEEELVAKKSRERMLKAYSIEKGNTGILGGTKKSLIDYATAEMSAVVWHGLVDERRKKWLINHSLWK